MDSIGIYMPRWLYRSDVSDRMFADELIKSIEQSGRYRPLPLDVPKLRLVSARDAEAFCADNRLVAIAQHDSRFYAKDERYHANVDLLERYVPFVNSTKAQRIGHDKIATKVALKQKNVPFLEDKVVVSAQELEEHLEEGKWYVIKPPDLGAGAGVKLVKKRAGVLFGYHDGKWRVIEAKDKKNEGGIAVTYRAGLASPMLAIQKLHIDFTYPRMLVEPYFNDEERGFSSLRCTVIGNEVVEAVKRVNRRNITSNVSSGGRAEKWELSDAQKAMAIAAKNAIGADYAGVDMLVANGKSVIGEVNIGPFTLFGRYTGVNVGKLFGAYLMDKLLAKLHVGYY